MKNDLETDIRMALDAKAHEVDVPVDLGRRTMQLAQEGAQPSLRERLRARLDAWRLRAPVTAYPRWLYAGAVAAMAVLLFAVGTLVRTGPGPQVQTSAPVAEPSMEGGGAQGGPTRDEARRGGSADLKLAEDADASASQLGSGTASQVAPQPPVPQRPGEFPPQIVRTANVELEVSSFQRAWSRAGVVATKHGGFVTNSEAGLERGTITMRIPATKLEAALSDVRELGKVVQMTTTAEDISAQIVDVDARVRTLEAEELQLIELLRQASGVGQVLEVRDRLNGVRQEIESLKAQRELFENQVEFATVVATLYESGAEEPDDSDDPIIVEAWRTALRAGLTILSGLVVVLGGLIPLAAIGLLIWFAVRTMRRRSA